jgi:hypothetical protein
LGAGADPTGGAAAAGTAASIGRLRGPRRTRVDGDRHRGVAGIRRRVGTDRLGGRAGEAEVDHLGAILVIDDHVRGLEVAVHEARAVGLVEACCRAEHHVADLLPRARCGRQPRAEREPVHQLHRDEDAIAEGPHVVDPDHVRVAHLRQRAALEHEPSLEAPRIALAARRRQQLDRHASIQLGIVRGEDLAQAAAAERSEDDVAPDRRAPRWRLRHRRRRSLGAGRAGRAVAQRPRRFAHHRGAVVARIDVPRDLLARLGLERPLGEREDGVRVRAGLDERHRHRPQATAVRWARRSRATRRACTTSITTPATAAAPPTAVKPAPPGNES